MPSVYLGDFPEPDRVEGAPHPRETARVIGHQAAQADFLASFNAGRLHHGARSYHQADIGPVGQLRRAADHVPRQRLSEPHHVGSE